MENYHDTGRTRLILLILSYTTTFLIKLFWIPLLSPILRHHRKLTWCNQKACRIWHLNLQHWYDWQGWWLLTHSVDISWAAAALNICVFSVGMLLSATIYSFVVFSCLFIDWLIDWLTLVLLLKCEMNTICLGWLLNLINDIATYKFVLCNGEKAIG